MANPVVEALTPFIWGAGGAKKTPEEIARDKEVAAELLMRAGNTSPVGHWTQGMARVVDALGGVVKSRRADAAGEENAAYNTTLLNDAYSALAGGASPVVASETSAIPTTGAAGEVSATAPGNQSYRDAIASIESAGSGDYAAVGPTHDKLGRALGRYQIMEANIGPWSQEALGKAVTPEEFLANPQLQDQIFDNRFGQYVNKFGPEGAAQAWLGGEGGVGRTDRKDVLGTSIGEYGQRFMNSVGGGSSEVAMATPEAAIQAVSPSGGSLSDEVAQFEQTPAYASQFPGMAAQAGQTQDAAQTPAVAQALAGDQQTQQQASGISPAILQALIDPRATPQTRAVVQALMQQQMEQNDPLRQLQLKKGQLEIEQMSNPGVDGVAVGNKIVDRRTGKVIYETPQDAKAPELVDIYDDQTGQPYKAQWNPETRQFERVGGIKAPNGTALTVGPDGQVQFTTGGAKPLTENQSKLTLFQRLQTETQPVLLDLENQWNPANMQDNAARSTPIAGNFFKSEQGQIYDSAATAWAEGALRIATGAAATPEEMERTKRAYFAQPGDTPNTISFKAQMREMYNRAINSAMGKPDTQAKLPNPSTFAKKFDEELGGSGLEIQTDIPGVKIRRKAE